MKKQKDKKEVKSVPFTALDKKEMSALNKLYQEMVLGVKPKDKKK
jgi:hypothetical protein